MAGEEAMNGVTVMRRLGLPGGIGLLLLAAAAWANWSWLPQQAQQADALGSQARRLRHEMLAAQSTPEKAQVVLTPEAAWQALLHGLPAADQRTALQEAVLASALGSGLSLSAVQFNGTVPGMPGLWRQRMTVPVEGRYDDVRAWLARLMAQPALSLDALDIQRGDVMSDNVKARASVSLWWRTEGGTR
jgi:Tfp pilus assembly protein PilO